HLLESRSFLRIRDLAHEAHVRAPYAGDVLARRRAVYRQARLLDPLERFQQNVHTLVDGDRPDEAAPQAGPAMLPPLVAHWTEIMVDAVAAVNNPRRWQPLLHKAVSHMFRRRDE